MSAPFDLNQDSQLEGDHMSWSQMSEVLSSQQPFGDTVVPTPDSSTVHTPPPPSSLSRAFRTPHPSPSSLLYPRPMRPSFSVPPHVLRPMAIDGSMLPASPTIREYNVSYSPDVTSLLPLSPNFQQPELWTGSPQATRPLNCTVSIPSIVSRGSILEGTEHLQNTINAGNPPQNDVPVGTSVASTTTCQQHVSPSQPLRAPSTEKGNGKSKTGKAPNNGTVKKPSKAMERRKNLADGEAANYRDQWSMEDFRVLADAKLRLDREMTEARGKNSILSLNERWRRVSTWCHEENVKKSSLQCRDKWENTFPKFKKIRDWDRAIPSGKNSYALMTTEERLEGGFPKYFDKNIYDILESRFGVDVLVDPGPILIDSSSEALGGGATSSSAAETSPKATMAATTSDDPSSTGKRRGRGEDRQTSVRKEFQDANKYVVESMERTLRERADQQQRQADLEQRQLEELLSLQNRQVHVAEAQLQLVGNSMDKLTNLLAAYLSSQAPPPA